MSSLFGRLPAATGSIAESFERFWRSYPRRRPNPKPPAARVFADLVRRGIVTADDLVTAVERYAREVEELGIQPCFVPHAVTWLRQRRFLDYLGEAWESGGSDDAAVGRIMTPPERDDLRAVWARIGQVQYRNWIAPLEIERRGPEVVITAPTLAHLDQCKWRYDLLLRQALRCQRIVWRHR